MKKYFLFLLILSTAAFADPLRDFFEVKKQIDGGTEDQNIRVRFAQLALATGNYNEAKEALLWVRKNNVPNWSEWATNQMKYLPMLGQKAPDFQGKDLEGWTVKMADYQGRVLLMFFWATTDGYSRQVLPDLQRIYKRFKSDPYFSMLGVSLDKDSGVLKQVVAEQKLVWPQMFETEGWNSPVVTNFQIHGTPSVVLVDGDGILRYIGSYGQMLEDTLNMALGKADDRAKVASSSPKVTPRSKEDKVICVQPLDIYLPSNLSKPHTKLSPGTVLKIVQSDAVPGMLPVIYDDPLTHRTTEGLISVSAMGENKK